MSGEPLIKRAVAFVDGQNLFRAARAAFGYTYPSYDVTALAALPTHRARRDTSRAEDVVRRFADQFWERDWPGPVRPSVFYDPRSVDPEARGVLHAKAVVADEERLFVTSANFTAAALDENIELGLLVRSRSLALGAIAHLQGLIDRGMLRGLPG